MGASSNALPRGVRLGRVALFGSILAFTLQPVHLFIAIRGDRGVATDGKMFLALTLALVLSLTAIILGILSSVRLRGAPDKARLPGLLGIVLGVGALIATVVVGAFSLLIASKGGWIYMS